ncbi:tetratricopeptide repeat protein [Planktomarina temperata]|nr:tetratricopeptide repeat protein [Planktomarina temperata]
MTELTIDQALQQGVEAHKAGQAQEADRLYTAILKAQPKHPDANHNMGVLAVGVGKVEQALPFFKAALEANPATAQFWLSYIDALIKLGKLADGKAVLDQAKSKGAKGDGFDKLEQRLKDAGQEPIKGKQVASEPQLKQPNILDTLKLDQAIKLAKKKAKAGSTEEAKCIYRDILTKFPKNKRASDGLKGLAGKSLVKASKAQDPPQDQLQSLINLYSQGQLQQALTQAETLVKQFPQSAILFNIQGAVLKGLGRLDLAIEAYNKALAIKPDYADAYNNMGNALKDQGKLEEAIEAYNKSLAIKPDYAEAYSNMGLALKGVVFKQPNPGLQKTIISLLDKKTFVRPTDIARAAISLLKFEPNLKRHLQSSAVAEPEPNLLAVTKDLSTLPLLLKLMSVCPLPDLALENLFSELRASLLLSISTLTGSTEELEFQSALALQCFINEYIYNQSEHEHEALIALETSVSQELSNGEQPSPQSILCLACYKPLNQYEWSSSLLITNEIEEVFTRQVAEPNEEANLKFVLPVLEEITNEVSAKVRDQYEVSPYPRWINLGIRLKPAPISKLAEEINLKLFDYAIKEVEAPNILIAGCGTGQHSIGTAARFKGSNVLAIDLSLSSLSYAKRKTEELDIQNIDYMQADILDLGKLGRQFDIVESAGVLHHMDDPVAGWRVLTDCLKAGGLMKIGLYSELARQHIVEMRQEISKAGIGSSDAAMKSFRTMVMTSDQSHHKEILDSTDFYSLSTLKDLLFHVQEHRFTIPQIQDCLEELGLKFCGFASDKIVSHFKLTNASAGDPYDLDKWQTYEEANPRAFAGMYQFWCQKLA